MSETGFPAGFGTMAASFREFGQRVDRFGASPEGVAPSSFQGLVRESLQAVNGVQASSRALAESYERGDSVPLTDVVLAAQRASLAFEATLQVRNKILKAYDDIMGMPV